MLVSRRSVVSALVASCALCASVALPAFAQSDYPTRPVRVVVPYPAGGSTDNIARPLAERLSRALGQQFVVENRGGAGGTLGAEVMAKAAADGYTIMITPQTPLVVLPNLRKVPYDPMKDFIPIGRMTEVVVMLGVAGLAAVFLSFLHGYLLLVRYSALYIMGRNVIEI